MQMKCNAICRPSRAGFTLVETLAVIALLAVIAVMATPAFVAWHVRDQVDARARALLSTFAYARSEALRRGTRVTVCRTNAARACLAAGQPCGDAIADWACGWAVLAERGGKLSLLRAQPSLAAVSITGVQTDLTFTPPAGQLIGAFRNFDIAPRSPSKAMQGTMWRRCIRIASGGRARISEGACGATS
ncbi:prepilin-type N-terminal cleavage/methylation domain-containing protein [Paraburkholderia sp. Ac-20336]|uniref:GspH/FimT family pseudopilin n=2 Tax=Burkholderiales TaxID=80840 RepID=UPI0014245C48|nr:MULTISPECIES: GspH/FimT family pseudopilin [Burkholderiaceae]MBN3804410.1 prepilin-type N-terminal cleavage/methylation domain-containing protein [Paraburkholderia sp. Ac-20336]MBN3847207.1 prepilin-type N-terminal cleavage/methylation domain-containing protein [Paraburkholderia sp. Ac-20342]NIF50631.1 prepilin-type N-terminal cleavage/methylation domain-containing protein [Burkholderia sp. Ax-1724]NIF76697.1 prepilin-type N-terminal cleavage/methylation domain-containing protein [Paraburkho